MSKKRKAPFVRESSTSEEAALSIEGHLPRLENVCYLVVAAAGGEGVTCDEAEVQTQLSHQTCSARIRGLVLRGRIVDSGRTRKTRSGRQAVVYVTKDHKPAGGLEQQEMFDDEDG